MWGGVLSYIYIYICFVCFHALNETVPTKPSHNANTQCKSVGFRTAVAATLDVAVRHPFEPADARIDNLRHAEVPIRDRVPAS